MKIFGKSGAWCLFLLGISFWLSAFASDLVYHRFEFDANSESPDIQVVAYRYGNSEGPGTSDQEHEYTIRDVNTGREEKRFGMGGQSSTLGDILRPDFLFVKWRIKATGEVLEDTVDLKHRLPQDFSRRTVHFTVDGRQLFVYLIGWEQTKPDSCQVWKDKKLERRQQRVFRMYCANDIQQIYP